MDPDELNRELCLMLILLGLAMVALIFVHEFM